MKAQAKIINMLLYDGSLGGVIRVDDSKWNSGELFSAPKSLVSELLKTGACNKYGVYLLYSNTRVYIGQSSDLAKRLSQHVQGKDWWESAVILTTKDDSLNHSDIDYLENVLIEKAMSCESIECDNKKSGNPPKVDVFRKEVLGQYLDEAFFLMHLIGINVFSGERITKRKRRTKEVSPPTRLDLEISDNSIKETDRFNKNENQCAMVGLPDIKLKIGAFVYESMRNLERVGYVFSDLQLAEMCTPDWSKKHFHTSHQFMKRFYPGVNNKGKDGYIRFKKEPYTFGENQVLISKEWYESQRKYFISWYYSLWEQNYNPGEKIKSEIAASLIKKTPPVLPDQNMKVGKFIRQAMTALSESGYEFSDEEISALCEEKSMKTILGMQRNLSFFKIYNPQNKDGHLIDGHPRYYSKPLTFGKYQVLLNSQLYESDKIHFIKWYEQLK